MKTSGACFLEAVIRQVLVPTKWFCNLPAPPAGEPRGHAWAPLRGEPGRKAAKGPCSLSDLAGSSASGSCCPVDREMLSIELNFCDPSRCILYRMKSHCTKLSLIPPHVGFLPLHLVWCHQESRWESVTRRLAWLFESLQLEVHADRPQGRVLVLVAVMSPGPQSL